MSDGGDWKGLFKAGCEGDLALVRYHVSEGVDLNYMHPEYMSTPLVAAVLAGQEQIALFMLDHGADPALRSEFEALTPMQAARRGKLPALQARLRELGVTETPDGTGSKRWWSFWRRGEAHGIG